MSDSEDAGTSNAPHISWPLQRHQQGGDSWAYRQSQMNGGPTLKAPYSAAPIDASVMSRGGSKSLSGISARAFGLGVVLGITAIATVQLAYFDVVVWRASCFVTILSLFHFLEFYATARYNPSAAKISSFLLSTNGTAYNLAHFSAVVEFLAREWLLRRPWQMLVASWLESKLGSTSASLLSIAPQNTSVILGFLFIAVGQGVRTAAMVEAGASFNHVVQSRKKDDHILVQSGVYRFSRHPSYFGFFWWGLGTQLMLGNHICFMAYSIILWQFFANRIAKEEQSLVAFFGRDYVRYRDATPVRIPFVA